MTGRRPLFALALIAAVASSASAPVPPVPTVDAFFPAPIRTDRVVVKLRAAFAVSASALPERSLPTGLTGLQAICGRYGIRSGHRAIRERGLPVRDEAMFRELGLDRTYVLELPAPSEQRAESLVRELSSLDWVEYAEPVYLYQMQDTVPDDPLFGEQWVHHNTGQTGGTPDADMDSIEGWDLTTGTPTTVVAVLDSGIDTDHPDLIPNALPGVDFSSDPEGIEDLDGHGTSAIGNVAARGNNGEGVAGVCFNCSVLPIKVFGTLGFASTEVIADAVRFAADSGADVISMSFGSGAWSQLFIDAVEYAAGQGALSLAAAGNSPGYYPLAGAAYPNVVSVNGTTDNDLRFGNYGDHAEIAAPTISTTTHLDGGYGPFGGTSAATPHAAGLAGLLRSLDPDLHPQEVRQLLRLGAEDQIADPVEDTPGWDLYMGFGRINVLNSLSLVDDPWIAFDRPHYVCESELAVDLRDPAAGPSVDVTLTGSVGGDVETLTVTPVTAFGYYRGSMPIAWADFDGPVVPGDGRIHLTDGEIITATHGGLSGTAFGYCRRNVCIRDKPAFPATGDCDADGVLDPGESWDITARIINVQTEEMLQIHTELTTVDPNVEIIAATHSIGDLLPFITSPPLPFSFRLRAGAPSGVDIPFYFATRGAGWVTADYWCAYGEFYSDFTLQSNSDGLLPDSWTAHPPSSLSSSDLGCPSAFDLTWDAVSDAGGYDIYRSSISCEHAKTLAAPYASSSTASFSDVNAGSPSPLYYAVEANEGGTGCVSERACVAGGCICIPAADPTNLRLGRTGDDVLLSWDDPGGGGFTWNVYRENSGTPPTWGAPLASGITDEDLGAPGIQFTDVGAAAAGGAFYYRVTADNACAESPLE